MKGSLKTQKIEAQNQKQQKIFLVSSENFKQKKVSSIYYQEF
jgi:hypothetical protein